MNPHEARRTLRVLWWLQLAVAVLPVWLFPAARFNLGLQTEVVLVVVLCVHIVFVVSECQTLSAF